MQKEITTKELDVLLQGIDSGSFIFFSFHESVDHNGFLLSVMINSQNFLVCGMAHPQKVKSFKYLGTGAKFLKKRGILNFAVTMKDDDNYNFQ